ncbi:putative 22.6kDa tegument-associated antigen [Schistosoma mansoni]|uniref:putative 22.6kDa tegument-associated antigen n=1 Tax=Schistosoma mansoni TaxID=6183 RepID=UPI0001A6335F|nr:putative 22.6kDa tegument-associated antigen [Schistosoma mansoni]|eukprot:XP_018654160.1 putative 22.6kDa tegument-associated antigen [Schistosoma mansoni]
MEKFIEIFLKLDSNNNNNGFIKKTELIQYCEKENMDMCMVDEWLKPFNSLDKISFREFCVVFGLKYEEMIMEKKDRENMAVGLSPKPDSDITIFSTSMSLQKQVDITNMFKETLNTKYTDEKSIIVIVNDMKKYLDEKYDLELSLFCEVFLTFEVGKVLLGKLMDYSGENPFSEANETVLWT